MSDQIVTFTTTFARFEANPLWGHHIAVPEEIARPFITEKGDRRVVCTLNGQLDFQCALMPKGDGSFFININKKIRDKLKLKVGMPMQVALRKDESQYGLPMPEELEELLQQDEEGNRFFHALTPGKQRNLLYIVGSAQKSDTRIRRAIVVIEHLKANGGKIDFKMLNQALREGI